MKVQSIGGYNSYNNRNLQEKECPKPCFHGGLLRKAAFFVGMPLALASLASCTKDCFECQQPNFTFNYYDDTDVTNIFKLNFNQTFNFFWNCNGDTIVPPLPPNPDTLDPTPGGDTLNVKPHEIWNSILNDLVLPEGYGDSLAPGQHFPVGNDTVGFTQEIDESLSYNLYETHREYDSANSTNVITAYKGYFMDNVTGQKYDFKSGMYPATYNGKPVYVEMIKYDGGKNPGIKDLKNGAVSPDVIIYEPGNANDKKTTVYRCDTEGNVLMKEAYEMRRGANGKYYSLRKWNNDQDEEYYAVTMKKEEDPAPVGGGKK